MKIKQQILNMDIDKRNYFMAIFLTAFIAYLLTFIDFWQLIIIPGVVAGIINYKKPRKGIYGGAIGISLAWTIYMIFAMITRNAYTNLDQFASIIIGDFGFGWIIIAIILIFGILFGALGGAIGSGTMLLVKTRRENKRESPSDSEFKNEQKKAQLK